MQCQTAAMPKSPQNEVPRGPVPQAAKEHRQEEIAVGSPDALAIAAEADVEIISQPARQADVPPPPELPQVGGGIGQVEVPHDVKPEDTRGAPRDVRITREVAIDLSREGNGAEKDGRR